MYLMNHFCLSALTFSAIFYSGLKNECFLVTKFYFAAFKIEMRILIKILKNNTL